MLGLITCPIELPNQRASMTEEYGLPNQQQNADTECDTTCEIGQLGGFFRQPAIVFHKNGVHGEALDNCDDNNHDAKYYVPACQFHCDVVLFLRPAQV